MRRISKKKKADISLQVIVVAILALLVLVILSVTFISRMTKWQTNVDSCESKGGVCELATDGCKEGWQRFFPEDKWCTENVNPAGSVCCLPP